MSSLTGNPTQLPPSATAAALMFPAIGRKEALQIIEALPSAIYTTDEDGRLTYYNEAAVRLWGRRPVLLQDRWCGSWRIFDAWGFPMELEACPMAVTLREGRPQRGVEIIVERPDGTRTHVLPHPSPLYDADGRMIGALNMLVDIGDRIAGGNAIRRLAAIVESSDDAIISKDLEGIITSWNAGAERLFGYTATEVLGKPVTMLIPPHRHDEEPGILQRIRQGERIDHYETTRQRKDGTFVEVSLTVSPLRDRTGRVIGASKIARDITARKIAERELKLAHEKAVAASRAKDEFLAALSHELRTPLNPVLLLASHGAEDPAVPAPQRADFATIRKHIELEARLIDDLLDLTRITRGKLALERRPQDLHTLLNDAISTVLADLDAKQLVLEKSLCAEIPLVFGDSVRLQQVFWNVMRNAVKFTPTGGRITVRTRIRSDDGRVTVEVQDSGIGMTPGELARVFEAFSQGDHAEGGASRRFGGMGLGLTIARMLTELHGGSIRADSPGRGRGSTFRIDLPLASNVPASALPASAAGEAPARPPASGASNGQSTQATILLVEDHEGTRAALERLLARRRFTVLTAGSVTEALTVAANHRFDLVISDIGLTDGTGHELMEVLRADYDLAGIALTGYGMDADVERSRAAGFVAHLIKPVTVEALDRALAEALKRDPR